MPSGSRGWSVAAGGYAGCSAAVLLAVLSPIATTLGSLLDLPAGTEPVVFAAPVVPVGAAVWWLLVERAERYTLLRGSAAGVATAALAVAVWVGTFMAVFGPALVQRGDVVIGFLLAGGVAVGSLQGLTAMVARGRLATDRSEETDRTAASASNE
jgi:hypothetical protein